MLSVIPLCFFPATPPIQVRDTYINDKHLASALLYKHGASKAGHE